MEQNDFSFSSNCKLSTKLNSLNQNLIKYISNYLYFDDKIQFTFANIRNFKALGFKSSFSQIFSYLNSVYILNNKDLTEFFNYLNDRSVLDNWLENKKVEYVDLVYIFSLFFTKFEILENFEKLTYSLGRNGSLNKVFFDLLKNKFNLLLIPKNKVYLHYNHVICPNDLDFSSISEINLDIRFFPNQNKIIPFFQENFKEKLNSLTLPHNNSNQSTNYVKQINDHYEVQHNKIKELTLTLNSSKMNLPEQFEIINHNSSSLEKITLHKLDKFIEGLLGNVSKCKKLSEVKLVFNYNIDKEVIEKVLKFLLNNEIGFDFYLEGDYHQFRDMLNWIEENPGSLRNLANFKGLAVNNGLWEVYPDALRILEASMIKIINNLKELTIPINGKFKDNIKNILKQATNLRTINLRFFSGGTDDEEKEDYLSELFFPNLNNFIVDFSNCIRKADFFAFLSRHRNLIKVDYKHSTQNGNFLFSLKNKNISVNYLLFDQRNDSVIDFICGLPKWKRNLSCLEMPSEIFELLISLGLDKNCLVKIINGLNCFESLKIKNNGKLNFCCDTLYYGNKDLINNLIYQKINKFEISHIDHLADFNSYRKVRVLKVTKDEFGEEAMSKINRVRVLNLDNQNFLADWFKTPKNEQGIITKINFLKSSGVEILMTKIPLFANQDKLFFENVKKLIDDLSFLHDLTMFNFATDSYDVLDYLENFKFLKVKVDSHNAM